MYNKITLSSVLDSELLATAQNKHLLQQAFELPNQVNNIEFKNFFDEV